MSLNHFSQRKISGKFCVHIFIISVSSWGDPIWRDLEEIEGSWMEAWSTGASLISWMTLFDLKDYILKVSGCYLHVL